MAKRKRTRKSRNNEFLLLAFVSVVIVVALFVAMPSQTGFLVKKGGGTPQDSTGTIWTCMNIDNQYNWYHKYDDGEEVYIPSYINAWSSPVNCNPDQWFCPSGNRCYADIAGEICLCRQQLSVAYDVGSS